ncbi:MAG: ribonuclease HI [Bacillota bacterium]
MEELDEEAGSDKEIYKIYTDGACSGNPGPGGYAAVILFDDEEKKIAGSAEDTTNNRMELKAVIEALKVIPEGAEVELYSDSTYVLNGLSEWIKSWKSKGWKTSANKEVANRDLWSELDILASKLKINYFKVEGHSGDHYNEIADSLAKEAVPENDN